MTKFTTIWISAVFILAACEPNGAPELDGAPLPGADRDAHNCIGSAGYQWSELLGECIRVFERGTALTDMRKTESTSSAYLVEAPGTGKVELFGTDGVSTILTQTADNAWRDEGGDFYLKRELAGTYAVYTAAGEKIYANDKIGKNDYTSETGADEDEVLKEFGIISEIEDGAYPFFSANMEFPERKIKMPFTLNIENLSISPDDLLSLEGQYVSIGYTSEIENMVFEIELDNAFLMETVSRDDLQSYKTVRGIMKGAAVTRGDLPGSFYIDVADGTRLHFEDYITEEMVAGNGHEVTVYLDSRVHNTIMTITPYSE